MAGSGFLASTIDAVNNSVRAAWPAAFNEAQNNLPWRDVTTDLGKSSTKIQTIDWIGETPDMEEVTRESTHSGGMGRFSYSITAKEYAVKLPVRILDLETDAINQIKPRIDGAMRKMAGHPGRLAFDQLEANPTAYDAAAFFANTHAFGAAANADNLAAGSGVTAADIEADLATVRATMMRYEDDRGEPMELSPNVLVIPPELSLVFQKVLGPVRTAGGDTLQVGAVPTSFGNKWSAGTYTVYELARLTDTNNWYALHTGGELKPFVFSWVTMPYLMNTPSGNDDSAKNRGVLEYVWRGVYNVGVSLPQYAVSVVN